MSHSLHVARACLHRGEERLVNREIEEVEGAEEIPLAASMIVGQGRRSFVGVG